MLDGECGQDDERRYRCFAPLKSNQVSLGWIFFALEPLGY